MNPAALVAKWTRAELSERAASQVSAELGPVGDALTIQKGVAVTGTSGTGRPSGP